jgi:hypothetical protein
MFCVLATNDDPHANHDATHDGDHYQSWQAADPASV